MSSRRGAPPLPPPRDPAGINTIVQRHSSCSLRDPEEDMSSDSSSPPRPQHKRRSSYENVDDQGFYPNKPPPSSAVRRSRESLQRSTPSPRPVVRSSPRHDSWSDALSDDTGAEPSVRRRPPSACGRAPRSHRGSMPPVDCLGSGWGHRPCTPCCGPSPVPYHWCGPPQGWSHYPVHQGNDTSYECEDLQQRICQLEMEKEQLALQVNVLSDQVEAQNEKIMELETSLSRSKEQLSSSEALLRKEMVSRSSIESSKLDLMSQISALRSRLSAVEEEKREIEERNRKLENELILTCACLAEKEADLATIKSKMARNGTVTPVFDCSPEMERLKGALSTVMAANDEKERKIQEMRTSLNRYKKLHELVLSNRTRKNSEEFSKKLPSEEDNIFAALENLASCDLDDVKELSFDYNLSEKPPLAPRSFQQNSTLLSICEDFQRPSSRLGDISRQSPLFSPIRGESPSPFSSLNAHRYNSSENVSPPTPQKTPPSKRHYSTLPRPNQTEILNRYIKPPNQSSQAGMSLAPEKLDDGSCSPKFEQSSRKQSSPLPVVPPKEKSKGLRKIFGRVKRTGSENLNSSAAELKRGGIRATAGPRLGWSEDFKVKRESFRVSKPFAEWDSSLISDWLVSIGLSMYVPDCKKWVKNGDQLLKASTSDFEKELNIKNPLHRKKLLLAINGAKEQTGDTVEPAGKIDHQWVVRWLDDIGLPQYKDAFYDARIDGRMLHQLTLEDLSHLKVTNLLHHISIKTGIQVLRENNFDPHCLQRRSLPDDEKTKEDVSRWTNHRVMEWLRTVDLSEYAPNLRGSGVHGGLMLYEPRFNADLMATLLNIPPNKTLLRRHLSTQFKQLIGPDVMQKKREWEAQANYTPLSPSAKVKTLKRSPFSLGRKKNKNEFDLDDFVCPMNSNEKLFGSMLLNGAENRTEEEKFLMKEMVLKNDKILESMPASNV
ncbi:liprin-beta-2-like isoform X2 [Argiope bruennichi]|uniref:liprin-beta-2-like isoform X2 n=1 Tax=Argiope bruennichi TaxID=94029 RepID=UPI002493F1E0|nr:liprin-beta-2-like isoform X2 [Argiope bruennichi]